MIFCCHPDYGAQPLDLSRLLAKQTLPGELSVGTLCAH
jgi:hypothetical protein